MTKVQLEIPSDITEIFSSIGKHLRYENRFSLPDKLEKIVNIFVDSYADNSITIAIGDKFWRARAHSYEQKEAFDAMSMGAPPPEVSSAGRINPQGISYLYCAYEEETAISEIRPWKGADVSVAEFETLEDVKAVDLSKTPIRLSSSDSSNISTIITSQFVSSSINAHYFSKPAHEHDELAYLTSQYIAERFKSVGIQAIIYSSVLHSTGKNIAFFSPNVTKCNNVNIFKINSVEYKFIKIV